MHIYTYMYVYIYIYIERERGSGCTKAVLMGAASSICSKQLKHPYAVPIKFFSQGIVKVLMVQPYNNTDTAIAQNSHFILSERTVFHRIDNNSLADHTFLMYMLTLLSVDKILLPRYTN